MNQLLFLDIAIVLQAAITLLVVHKLFKLIVGTIFFFTQQMFQNFLPCPSQGKKM